MADPTPLRAGVLFSVDEAQLIAEALVTIQQVAARGGALLIDKLDEFGGDPDLETEAIEDDFTPMPKEIDFGPGCDIADPGEEDDPSGCEHDGREPDESGLCHDYGVNQTSPIGPRNPGC